MSRKRARINMLHRILPLLIAWVLVKVSSAIPRFHQLELGSPANEIMIRSTIRKDLLSKCNESYRESPLDHFTFVSAMFPTFPDFMVLDRFMIAHMVALVPQGPRGVPDVYKQRYFVCDAYWRPHENGPVFFYFGNEVFKTTMTRLINREWNSHLPVLIQIFHNPRLTSSYI